MLYSQREGSGKHTFLLDKIASLEMASLERLLANLLHRETIKFM